MIEVSERSASWDTLTEVVAVLFPATGSTVLALTVAELGMFPSTMAVAVMVMEAVLLLERTPKLQVTWLAVWVTTPWLLEASTRIIPAGSVSLTFTP